MKTAEKPWTYEDYLKLEDDRRYEVLEGELVEMPAPGKKHQEACLELAIKFASFLRKEDKGKLYLAPFYVVLSEHTVLQPDLVVVLKENLHIVEEKGIFGAPDLVVEIVSPSTFKRDVEDKRKLYARYGVKEFWLVLPEERVIEVLVLKGQEYEVFSHAYEKGKVCSKLLEGFCVALEEVFA